MLKWERSSWHAGCWEVDIQRHSPTEPKGWQKGKWAPKGDLNLLTHQTTFECRWSWEEASKKGLVLQKENRQGGQFVALSFCCEFSGFLEDLCSVCVLENKFVSVQCWLQRWGADRWTQKVWYFCSQVSDSHGKSFVNSWSNLSEPL